MLHAPIMIAVLRFFWTARGQDNHPERVLSLQICPGHGRHSASSLQVFVYLSFFIFAGPECGMRRIPPPRSSLNTGHKPPERGLCRRLSSKPELPHPDRVAEAPELIRIALRRAAVNSANPNETWGGIGGGISIPPSACIPPLALCFVCLMPLIWRA